MSVISNLTVTPNRLEIICRYLRSCGGRGVSEQDLKSVLAPPALRQAETSGVANETVLEARRMGLIVGASDCYRLTPHLAQGSDEDLLEWLEGMLLDPGRAEAAGQGQLPYALAWLLEQDPAEPLDFGDNIKDMVAADYEAKVEAFEMSNRSRSQNVVYWAQYLGYAWPLGTAQGPTAVVPDPTQALQRHLPPLLAARREMPIDELLQAWGTRCPVLEGGAAREGLLGMYRGSRRDPKMLSRSTSLALQRLTERQLITLERRADAPAFLLNLWPDPEPISHIILQQGG